MSACNGQSISALATFAYEGAFASPPIAQNLELLGPFHSALAGALAPRSNDPGTIQGRFGWLNVASGLVNNTRLDVSDTLGVVIPYRSLNGFNGGVVGGPRGLAGGGVSWTWEFYDPAVRALRVRPGLVVTLHDAGNFWLRFPGGAIAGNSVYASLVDGTAVSGPADNCELTPFKITSIGAPGSLAIVSSTAFFPPS